MGLSIWHILLFAVVVILLFGTSKLKNIGKDLGGAIKDFKDSIKDEGHAKGLELKDNEKAKVIENISEKTVS